MRLDPSLFVNRLQILKGNRPVYDECFHRGLNMIRSDGNSRGKSTITDFIFFSLGGDLLSWKPVASTCDFTLIEVQISGSVFTLRREIKVGAAQQPMWISFGDLKSVDGKDEGHWERFAYRRYEDRESFSQLLFRHLKLQETPTEESNITVNQILRFMYVDQITPVNRIFRIDDRDSPLRRQAIGDLLCGIYDKRIYPAQIRARQVEKDYAQASSQLTSLLNVLRRVDENVNFTDLLDATRSVERERQEIAQDISRLKKTRQGDTHFSTEESGVVRKIIRDIDRISADIAKHNESTSRMRFEIADADLLRAEIEKSLRHIDQAQTADRVLSPLMFSFCPSCFSSIDEIYPDDVCHLCKSKIDPAGERSRFARMRNELELQAKESAILQNDREIEYRRVVDEVAKLDQLRSILTSELTALIGNFTNEAEAQIDSLSRRLGYLDRELVELEREKRLGVEVARLASLKESLNGEISALRSAIQMWISQKDKRQSTAYGEISKYVSQILSQDLASDIGPVTPEDVSFNFTEDRVEIADRSSFSASSLTIIRNSFHLAVLAASCADKNFDYPRFLLMDNIEDKGMVPERSKNFQRTMLALSESLRCEHQIIFTTSMPDDSLETPEISIGDKYSAENYSLKIDAYNQR